MPGLSRDLLRQCYTLFQKCHQFKDEGSLRAVFSIRELEPFRDHLPRFTTSRDFIHRTVAYLLEQTRNTQPAFPNFILALRLHNAGNELCDELEHLYQEVILELGLLPEEPKIDHIEFVDRNYRLDEVFLEVNEMQCWIIDAPAGYGKSRFIEKVKERYECMGWACCYLEIQRKSPPKLLELAQQILEKLHQKSDNLQNLSVEKIGGKIADASRQILIQDKQNLVPICDTSHRGIALFLDSVEVLDDTTFIALAEMINGIFSGLKETDFFIKSNQLRVFLSGRDIRRRSTVFHSKGRTYRDFTLSPYTFPFVEEAVRKYTSQAKITLDSKKCSNLAARFMYFNGGHPGCIAETLTQLRDHGALMVRDLLQSKEVYLENSFGVLADLEKDNEEIHSYLQVLETLSVFRSFGSWLLRELIEQGYVAWQGDIYQLRDELMSTYLLHPEGAFVRDNITQRLFSRRLKHRDPERFIDLCRVGATIYWERLCSQFNYPEQLAVEYLYQRLQCAYHAQDLSGSELRDVILESLTQTMQEMTRERDTREVLPHFLQRLEKDWELEFLTNYYLDDASYDHGLYRAILAEFKQQQGTTYDTRS